MRKIVFLNEAKATTSAVRSNAINTAQKTQEYLATKADRLPADQFNSIVIKAESEAATDPESIVSRISELESIKDRTPGENAELKGLRLARTGFEKYGQNYKTTQQRLEYQKKSK